jgi:hypothetical protein
VLIFAVDRQLIDGAETAMNSIEIAISQIGLAAAVFLPIYKLFDFVEENVAAEPKKAISAWLKDTKNSDPTFVVSKNIIHVFQTLYGAKQFSTRCIGRVVLLSTLAMLISLTVVGGWKPLFAGTEKVCLDGDSNCWDVNTTQYAIKALMVYFFCVNIPIDYIAVGVTRFLLARSRSQHLSLKTGLGFLIFDVVAKAILAFLGIFCVKIFDPDYILGSFFGALYSIVVEDPLAKNTVKAAFLAMLLVSLWIWIYYFSLLAFGNIARMRWFLDIEEHPIRSVGLVTAAASTVVYGLVLLIFQLHFSG